MDVRDRDSLHKLFSDTVAVVSKMVAKYSFEDIERFLVRNFGLSRKESKQLLNLVDSMLPGVNHDALYCDSWFTHNPVRVVKDHKTLLCRERSEVIFAIRQLRKLPEDKKLKAASRWPEKYREMLIKKQFDTGDEIYDEFPEDSLANIIIAEKYNSKPSTIKTYC